MRLRISIVLAVLLCAAIPTVVRGADPDSLPAISAMTGWLHRIDAGQYGESWNDASSLFRSALTREKWIEALNGTRRPLASMTKRFLKGADYRRSLPGAPDGEYFVIQFEASFANKEAAIETVTAMKEKGAWKAAGYFIR